MRERPPEVLTVRGPEAEAMAAKGPAESAGGAHVSTEEERCVQRLEAEVAASPMVPQVCCRLPACRGARCCIHRRSR